MTTSPRIAIVAASLDILGGQGVQAASLVESLDADGYDVRFVPINPVFPRGLRWARRMPGLRTMVNQHIYVPSLIRLDAVDVVHVFSASYWSFLLAPVPAMLIGRMLNKRVVLHYHSGEADDHLARWGRLVHPFIRLADVIAVPSEYLRRVFAKHGYTVEVVPNVVDVTRFRYRERQPLGPRVLSTRNLEAYYRIDLVIEAFARFRAVEPSATLTIAGCGSEEPRLRRRAADIGGNAVQFVGKVDPAAMPRLLDDHDIFVNASTLDNQPVSILEACAAGIPIVSSSAGDIPAMVRDGETALLAPVGDAIALGDGIVAVWRDPDAARARARLAHVEVANYSWPAVRARWDEIYRREGQEGQEGQERQEGIAHPALPVHHAYPALTTVEKRADQNVIIAAESR
jgi:glycosyltransferase involved in cell wall biosynthesis